MWSLTNDAVSLWMNQEPKWHTVLESVKNENQKILKHSGEIQSFLKPHHLSISGDVLKELPHT